MLDKYQAKTAGALSVLGFVFLVAFSTPIIFPSISSSLHDLCIATQIIIWILFLAHYITCIALAQDRRAYIRANIFGLACVLLPVLEPFRALRALAVVIVAAKKRGSNKRRSLIMTTSTVALATWFFAGLAITEAERNAAERTIHNVGDGWWWAITTMATVGYGDTYPVTTGGRIVGGILMVISIALIGTMTATIASYFTEIFGIGLTPENNDAPVENDTEAVLRAQILELNARIDQLTNPPHEN